MYLSIYKIKIVDVILSYVEEQFQLYLHHLLNSPLWDRQEVCMHGFWSKTMVLKDLKPQLNPRVHTWSRRQGMKDNCFIYRSALAFQYVYFSLSLLQSPSNSRSIVSVAVKESWAFSWAFLD
jgi:hypothetical protein